MIKAQKAEITKREREKRERERRMADSSGYKEYVAGLLAGVATVAIGHPFDTIKVKMQKHNTVAHGITYRNSFHCTARILKTEGIKGLYRGATSSFVGMAFESSLLFGMYSQMKQSLQRSAQGAGPQLQVIIPSAAYSGAIISFILCPSELVKDASSRHRLFGPNVQKIRQFS